jgi:predicted RNA-binding protein Jag
LIIQLLEKLKSNEQIAKKVTGREVQLPPLKEARREVLHKQINAATFSAF